MLVTFPVGEVESGEWVELQAVGESGEVRGAERRALAERTTLQARVSRMLAEAGIDYEAALDEAVRQAANLTGDGWILRVFDAPKDTTAFVAIHDADAAVEALLQSRLPAQPGAEPTGLSALVLRDGVGQRFGPDTIGEAIALSPPGAAAVIRDLGTTGVLTVPLHGRDGSFGTLCVLRHHGGLGFDDDEHEFVDDMASRIAATLDTARLLTRAMVEVAERQRAESALASQHAVLERLARGEPIADTLRELCLQIEQQFPGTRCSVLLHDSSRSVLRYVAGPSLPAAFALAIDGLPVAPDTGCCGAAAYRRATVVIADTLTDPLTASFVDLARAHDVRACWSHPVVDRTGEVLGTFAVYRSTPYVPEQAERQHVEATASLVGLALERQRAERALAYAAQHDPLTGLPNRVVFLDRVAHAQQRARRLGTQVAVMFFDLDRFKLVNDSLGHVLGDGLLVEAAGRLTNALGDATVARFGGDEFIVLFEDVSSLAELERAADRLGRVLAEPFVVGGGEFFLSASVGIALGDASADPESLVRDADAAMYRAKARGSARYEVFDGRMRDETVARVQLEADLRRALERGELLVHYQPIIRLADGGVDAVEALVRWKHPERGVLSPADFLPVAEETGLITTLGEWVLETAVAQHAEWARQGVPPVRMSVNLSPRQVMDPTLSQTVAKILDRHEVDPGCIAIELTETAIMEDVDTAAAMVDRLAGLGVRILIDDFGTGYSSIAHLQRLPVSGIKIDRDFIAGIATDERSAKLIGALIALAHALNLDVVAEGVDNEAGRDLLRGLGCEFAQGYLFSPPVPPGDIAALLR